MNKLNHVIALIILITVTLSNGKEFEIPDGACMMRRGGWFGTIDETAFAESCDEEKSILHNEYARFRTDQIVSIVKG